MQRTFPTSGENKSWNSLPISTQPIIEHTWDVHNNIRRDDGWRYLRNLMVQKRQNERVTCLVAFTIVSLCASLFYTSFISTRFITILRSSEKDKTKELMLTSSMFLFRRNTSNTRKHYTQYFPPQHSPHVFQVISRFIDRHKLNKE